VEEKYRHGARLMVVLGIVLGVAGIVLTVLLSDPFFSFIKREVQGWKAKRRWSADLQVRRAVIPKLSHYAFEFWHQVIEVDGVGNAVHTVDAKLINLQDGLLAKVSFPAYADAANIPASELSPWALMGRRQLEVFVDDWIPQTARGRVWLKFDPPLRPGERKRFRWGYRVPDTFRPGDEYYNIDVANPLQELSLEFRFSHEWSVSYVRWDPAATAQHPPAVKGRTIKGIVRFPEVGKRITMRFGLTLPSSALDEGRRQLGRH
jgi:hypothetical protein